ncbi:hypothetical protein [Nocardia tengchongensis]|uniref:hypothetical protein n=1 Tax=Nocardia tengchongensis TaxID=2055889 RepID=UPI00361B94CE
MTLGTNDEGQQDYWAGVDPNQAPTGPIQLLWRGCQMIFLTTKNTADTARAIAVGIVIVGAGMVLRNGFGWVVHLAATYPYRAGLITVSIAACGAAPTALKKFQGWRAAQAVESTAKAACRRAQAGDDESAAE